jgi:hypothetical protein
MAEHPEKKTGFRVKPGMTKIAIIAISLITTQSRKPESSVFSDYNIAG